VGASSSGHARTCFTTSGTTTSSSLAGTRRSQCPHPPPCHAAQSSRHLRFEQEASKEEASKRRKLWWCVGVTDLRALAVAIRHRAGGCVSPIPTLAAATATGAAGTAAARTHTGQLHLGLARPTVASPRRHQDWVARARGCGKGRSRQRGFEALIRLHRRIIAARQMSTYRLSCAYIKPHVEPCVHQILFEPRPERHGVICGQLVLCDDFQLCRASKECGTRAGGIFNRSTSP
jgi:hypothetical protein